MKQRNSFKNIFNLIDAEINNLEPHESFLTDLKRSIELDDEKQHRVPSKTYKPSSMNCIRASYYQLIGAQQDTSASSYMGIGICNSGTDIHIRMQIAISSMKDNGMDCEYISVDEFVTARKLEDLQIVGISGMETKLFHKKLNMSFLCDGIIKYRNHYYILEIKTESSYKFMMRKAVDPSHYNQATCYSIAFGLDEVLFLYINRDLLDMKSFILTVTDDMKQSIISYIDACNGYVNRMVVPPKPDAILNKTCQYCNYKTRCKTDK